jgi:glucose/mannose transport system permease protein
MASAGIAATDAGRGRPSLRVLLYLILGFFALFYLAPLYVMVATSLKSVDEIRLGNLLALPQDPSLAAVGQGLVVGLRGRGVHRHRSVLRELDQDGRARGLHSTMIGALNGYALTKWKFKGADLIFTLMLFGCFIPFQIVLVPMARTLGTLGIASSTPGLVLVHVVYGICFTTLFFRNYYAAFPTELVKAATIDGAGFFRIFWRVMLPNSGPILVVTLIWQFTNVWNDFLFGASFAGGRGSAHHRGAEQRRQHLDRREGVQRRHGLGDADRPADAARLRPRRPLLRARPDGRLSEGLSTWPPSPSTTSRSGSARSRS